MAACAFCQYDLRETTDEKLAINALIFQQAADQTIRRGQGLYGDTVLPSTQWFDLSLFFVMLLRKIALKKLKGLVSFAKTLGIDTEIMKPTATGLSLELLPVQERIMLLADVWKVLEAGPKRLYEAAKTASLSVSSLQDHRRFVPPCIKHCTQGLPGSSTTRKWKKCIETQKPRSRQAVERMWARLQRKMAGR